MSLIGVRIVADIVPLHKWPSGQRPPAKEENASAEPLGKIELEITLDSALRIL